TVCSLSNQQRIIIFGGGLPVIFNEQVIGAVGVNLCTVCSLSNQQRIIIFGGGLPVIFNEQVIGAVGV
ncbi:hypothetical protein C7D72_30085, partial [Klebsiella pneumoniae]